MCSCPENYFGSSCQFFNVCSSEPCFNDGSCSANINYITVSQYICTCPPDATGDNCETFDPCLPEPCLNGATCLSNDVGFTCICPTGYAGDTCQVDIDVCDDSSCSNGATCIDGSGLDFICLCPPSFTGAECDVQIFTCESDTCKNNGTCTQVTPTNVTCGCAIGFEGERCQKNIDDCTELPCQNGGTCVDGVDDFMCLCTTNYTGSVCAEEVDFCSSNPCSNGNCTSMLGGFACECDAGFMGELCEIKIFVCNADSCQNNATCVEQTDAVICICPAGFTDSQCETNIDDCASNPCQQDAVCTDLLLDYFCDCPPGFSGKECNTQFDFCIDDPCFNGNCSSVDGVFACECRDGWEGERCQYASSVTTKFADCGVDNSILLIEGYRSFSDSTELNATTLEISGTVVVSTWVWLEQGDGVLFSLVDDDTTALALSINSSHIVSRHTSGAMDVALLSVPLSEWHHVSLTVSPTGAMDVVLDGSTTSSLASLSISPLSNLSIYIGRDGTDALDLPSFSGILREFSMVQHSPVELSALSSCLLACADASLCQNEAQCLDFASFQEYHCQCSFGYTGGYCQYEHDTFSLDGSGIVTFTEPAVSPDTLTLQFKSPSTNADILEYVVANGRETSLRLESGDVVLSVDTPCNNVETVEVDGEGSFGDDQWHTATAAITNNTVSLTVDGHPTSSIIISCQLTSSVGTYSLSSSDMDYDGCVRDITINGGVVSGRNAQLSGDASFGCTQDTAQFLGLSYLELDNFTSPSSNNISLDFATTDNAGILYYSRRAPTEATGPDTLDFIAIHLVDGKIAFSFNLGEVDTSVMIVSNVPVNDGNWHHLDIYQMIKIGELVVDGVKMTGESASIFDRLDVTGHVFLGGVPMENQSDNFMSNYQHFTGCLRDLMQNGNAVDLQEYITAQHMHFGTCN